MDLRLGDSSSGPRSVYRKGSARSIILQTLLWVSVTLVLASVCHLYSQWGAAESRKALETALNPKADYEARHTAALKLSEPDRLKIQELLMRRIPGEWDIETIRSLNIIKITGDKSCLHKLKWLSNEVTTGGYEMNGKFNYVLRTCIEQLETGHD